MATNLTSRLSQRSRLAHGQPISDLMSRALANPQLISLAAGFVDTASLPCEETIRAVGTLFSALPTSQPALQYGTTAGFPPLRDMILQRHCEADGIESSEVPGLDRVILTAGSNQLLHLVAEALLDPGDIVLCTAPTYFVYTGILQNVDARAVGVDVDDQGMVPESLEEHLRRLDETGELARVKAIYLVSYYDNPRGLTMPLSKD